MSLRRASLLLGLALALVACGKQESAQRAPGSPPRAASAASSGASKPAASAQNKSAAAAGQPSSMNRLNEDGSETVEENTGDSGTHNPLLAAVASTVAAATSAAAAATTTPWQSGVNYTQLVPAQPTAAPVGQVEVLEFFWYACPHCFSLQPLLETWEKSKPAYISFSPVPVLWNEGHRSLARLYYTLETLGKLKQYHGEVFKEIQVNGNPLIGSDPDNVAQAERIQVAFAKKLGISEADFEKAYHSFAVETAMQRADELVQRYRVSGVPTFVVNGKYITDVAMAGGPEKLLALVSDLAAQEHKH